jgi:hypothetical protein
MAVPHDAVATVRQFQVLPLGDEGIGFRNQNLVQHSAGAFTCNFGRWIIDSFRLTERDDGGISQHGVSLVWGFCCQAMSFSFLLPHSGGSGGPRSGT